MFKFWNYSSWTEVLHNILLIGMTNTAEELQLDETASRYQVHLFELYV
jgi:hypothetical protein